VSPRVRSALAGVAAAAAWAGAEPLLRRLFRTPYSDVRLLGRVVTTGRAWPAAGTAMHLANGAVFGLAWDRLGGGGWKRGIVVAQLENLALWPAMVIVDRYHPDRRSGVLPPLLRNGRVFAYEVTTHAVFGAVLGLLSAPDSVAPP
jgi:hypothetical protein